jgi:4-amino-4-deoxy-L-arabinose transferase-like glycosyltransferase
MADYVATAPARPRPAVAAARPAAVPGWVRWIPLAIVLCGQALLTSRLIHVSTASGDEGRYIYAGHQLIHEIFHGGGSPYYETYFSGAPVIYPVLAAMADHLGGLVAVRLMSMSFMMTATTLLYGSGKRLFGYWPGVAAAGLFAGLGLTEDLGALATHDALALLLTAASAYCAVRTSDTDRDPSRWLVLVPIMLLAANAAKYATLVFDPVVVGIAALQVLPDGWRRVFTRAVALGVTTVSMLALAAFLAGRAYINGFLFSTLDRKAGSWAVFSAVRVAPRIIVGDTWDWVGFVILLGGLAFLLSLTIREDRRRCGLLLGLLVFAGVLVTIESLHLHTVESMRKHDDIGIWFTCMAAGYLLARPSALVKGKAPKVLLAMVIPLAIVASGTHYSKLARSTYEAGTSAARRAAFGDLKRYLELPNGRYLIGGLDNEQLVYSDHLSIPWYRLYDDVYIKYPIPGRGGDTHGETQGPACLQPHPYCMYLEGLAGWRAAIKAHFFALISMLGDHNSEQDKKIEWIANHTPGYQEETDVGGEPTWFYVPVYQKAHVPLPDATVAR